MAITYILTLYIFYLNLVFLDRIGWKLLLLTGDGEITNTDFQKKTWNKKW